MSNEVGFGELMIDGKKIRVCAVKSDADGSPSIKATPVESSSGIEISALEDGTVVVSVVAIDGEPLVSSKARKLALEIAYAFESICYGARLVDERIPDIRQPDFYNTLSWGTDH